MKAAAFDWYKECKADGLTVLELAAASAGCDHDRSSNGAAAVPLDHVFSAICGY
jgi:hypothetical protein